MMKLFSSAPAKSVDSVLSAFNQAIDDLQEVHDREVEEVRRQEEIAAQALTASNAARSEAARAAEVGLRLRNLTLAAPEKGEGYEGKRLHAA